MTTYVIMQADTPRAVLSDQARALEIVADRNATERKLRNDPLTGYWHVRHFVLNLEPV